MDAQHVKRALEAMGLNPQHVRAGIYDHNRGSYNHETGEAVWRTSAMSDRKTPQELNSELKRAYSTEILNSQAARYGWTLRQSPTNRNQYTIAKR